MRRTMHSVVTAAGLIGLLAMPLMAVPGCDDPDGPGSSSLGLAVTPLTGTACGDPDSPAGNPNPFAEAPNVTVAVRGLDTESGVFATLVSKSQTLKEGRALKLKVPEGPDREVVVFARGGSQSWFGRDTGLLVTRNVDTAAAMTLTRYDGFSCVPVPDGVLNTVFPAAVTMGDGRILVVGGFTQVIQDDGKTKLSGATAAAFVYDPRTGQTKSVGNLGVNQGRAAATAVYLPETNKVLILGGTTELEVDTSREFPFKLDATKAKNDYILFDPVSESFAEGTKRMRVTRAFARAAALADGTVLVTGGQPWPLQDSDRFEAGDADIFDPQDNDGEGGFLDIPKLRGFYPRAGHSLTFLKNTAEGLTQLLIWGGTTQSASLFSPAEIYRQSGRQKDGVNGTFAEVTLVSADQTVPSFTFFHEVTRLSGNRFLATGGAVYHDGAMGGPQADEAWLLTYTDNVSPTVLVQRASGFGVGRMFHTAVSDDLRHVAVIGGWGADFQAIAAPDHVLSFDVDAPKNQLPFWTTATSAGSQTTPRGGHAVALTPAGTVYVVGGELAWDQVSTTKRAASEIYTPAFVSLP